MLIPKVLVVNDDPATLLALESLLTGKGWSEVCQIVTAQSGEEALRCVLRDDFAVILLDVQMPCMDGFETAEAIHSHPRSAGTPIIFTTAFYDDDMHRLKGYQNGAVDYLLTPVIPQILQTKVSVFVELAKRRLEPQHKTACLESINDDLNRRHADDLRRLNSVLSGKPAERRQSERRRSSHKHQTLQPNDPAPARQAGNKDAA
jgi:CheY-like chemotaxis protein